MPLRQQLVTAGLVSGALAVVALFGSVAPGAGRAATVAALDIHFNPLGAGDPVNFVSTGAGRFRTAAGIHPGSTVTALKRAYRRLHGPGPNHSLYGKRGEARTDFNTANARIQTIDIQGLR